MDDAGKEFEDANASERATRDAGAYQYALTVAEERLEQCKFLLEWIEQQRRAMDAEHSTLIEGNHDDLKAVRKAPAIDLRKRRPEARPVLGPPRSRPAPGRDLETQVRQTERAAPETQWTGSPTCHGGLERSAEQPLTETKRPTEQASTHQERDASPSISSTKGVQAIRQRQCTVSYATAQDWTRTDSRRSTIQTPAGPATAAVCRA